ncbi:MAG: SPASM domain-containing protein [Terriglobia bacterium]
MRATRSFGARGKNSRSENWALLELATAVAGRDEHADGAVRPCFFHPAIGNIQDGALSEVINSEQAMQFRQGLDVATNAICRRCVCSIYIPNATITHF